MILKILIMLLAVFTASAIAIGWLFLSIVLGICNTILGMIVVLAISIGLVVTAAKGLVELGNKLF